MISKNALLALAVGLTAVFVNPSAVAQTETLHWDAVCSHLGELLEIDVTGDMCAEMEREVSADCGDNERAAMRCILAAVDRADFEACEEICDDGDEQLLIDSRWGPACSHIGSLLQLEITPEMCTEGWTQFVEDCGGNMDAALGCILAAEDEAAFVACGAVCESTPTAPSAPQWDAVCAHLGELLEIDVTSDMCTEMEREVSADCGDNEPAAIRCILAAVDMTAFEACEGICDGESTLRPLPAWAAVCAHLGEMLQIEVTGDMCAEMERAISAECGAKLDSVMSCVMAAENQEAYADCLEVCETARQ